MLLGEGVRLIGGQPDASPKGGRRAEWLPHGGANASRQGLGIEVEGGVELDLGVPDDRVGPGTRTHAGGPGGQRDGFGALGALAGHGARVEDGALAVHDADDPHVVEGDQLANGGRDSVEDVL